MKTLKIKKRTEKFWRDLSPINGFWEKFELKPIDNVEILTMDRISFYNLPHALETGNFILPDGRNAQYLATMAYIGNKIKVLIQIIKENKNEHKNEH